ncbi:MAG: glycosyltransferase family 2 protein, partial [Lachnospira sp.]
MDRPKVSVIIPTYNRAYILRRAVDSVLNQTYDNFELIIVDDGSADNTRQIVESYSDERIKYYYTKLNKGAAAARNYGIDNATCDYIAF